MDVGLSLKKFLRLQDIKYHTSANIVGNLSHVLCLHICTCMWIMLGMKAHTGTMSYALNTSLAKYLCLVETFHKVRTI